MLIAIGDIVVHRQFAGQHALMVADLAHPAEVVHHGDQDGDPLDTAPPGQAPDGRLGDPLDVVEEKLEVHLDSTLAQSLATCSHDRNESSRLSAFNQEQEQFDSPSLL